MKKATDGFKAPKYGKLESGAKSIAFILEEPEEGAARLYIDTNGDGDLTNDPATEWAPRTGGGQTTYSGTPQIDLGGGKVGSLGMYRFDPKDSRRPQLYYADFGYEVSISLDGKIYTSS